FFSSRGRHTRVSRDGSSDVCSSDLAVRHDDGTLTATSRTGRVRVWSWAIAPLDSEQIFTGTTIEEYVEKAAELGGVHWFHNLRRSEERRVGKEARDRCAAGAVKDHS